MPMHLRLSPLSTDECWARLRSATTGRVSITAGALPVIVPVLFGIHEESPVFRVAPGTQLSDGTDGAVVAFEADELVRGNGQGWSVVLQGIAHRITHPVELDRVRTLSLPMVTPAGHLDRFVAISVRTITGRSVHVPEGTFGPGEQELRWPPRR